MRFLSINGQAYSSQACAKLFGKAKESIKVIIPDININFFWDDRLIKALKEAVARGVAVKVAHCETYNVGKIGILGVPGIEIFKLNKPHKRLVASVDAKHIVIERSKPRIRKIESGLILKNSILLAHEADATFDELTGT